MKEFKLIVAGGRDYSDAVQLAEEVTKLAEGELADFAVSLVSGMARGADKLAVDFAQANGVKLHEFHADWDKLGKVAGFRRNTDMANFADGLIAFWDGQSRGTKHMIETMEKLNKPVRVIKY